MSISKQNDLSLAEKYFEEARILQQQAKYKEAFELSQKAVVIYEKWEVWEDWIEVGTEIGFLYIDLVKYDEGIKHLEQLINTAKIYFDKEHPQVAYSLHCLANCYSRKGSYQLALDYLQEALTIRKKKLRENHPEIARNLHLMGICYDGLGNYDLAIENFQKTLVIRKKILDNNHVDIARTLNSLGICYYHKANYESALQCYQKAMEILNSLEREDDLIMNVLNNFGICYWAKGDNALAIRYHQKNISIRKKKMGENHPSVALSLSNLCICYRIIGEYDRAIRHNQEALAIRKKSLGEYHVDVGMSLSNLGDCYLSKSMYQMAIHYYEDSLDIWEKNLGDTHINMSYGLVNLGLCYKELKNYPLAIEYIKKSLTIRQKNLGTKHPLVAMCWNNLGKTYAIIGKNELSLSSFQEAILSAVPSFNDRNILRNPNIQTYSNGSVLLEAFGLKAKMLCLIYTHSHQNIVYLQAALSTICLATKLISNIRQSYEAEGSKHTLAQEGAIIYDIAIKTVIEVVKRYSLSSTIPPSIEFTNIPHTPQDAKNLTFDFSEQCKATLLLSSIKDNEAKLVSKIPIELLEEEKQLRKILSDIDKKITEQEAKDDKKDEVLLSHLQSEYFEEKQTYDQLIEQFETDYPEYHQLKYSTSTASIQDLQSYLSNSPFEGGNGDVFSKPTAIQPYNHSTILSYHIAEKQIYIFAITSNNYHIATVSKPENFSDTIEKLQKAIQLGHIENFLETATQLFDWLLQPIWKKIQNTSKLIVIPHGELYYVPFDVLINQAQITDSQNFENLPYLIRDFDISYHYSATLLLHSHKRQQQTNQQIDSFFGFAPIQFGGEKDSQKREGYVVKSSSGKQEHHRRRILKSSGDDQVALQDLEETEVEVKEVYQLFEEQGKEAIALFYDQANKQNLQEHIGGYKYVLISTHGFLQEMGKSTLSGIHLAPSNSTVSKTSIKSPLSIEASTEHPSSIHKASTTSIESDNFILHTSETYHLNLNADLVVLSSCESGVGELKVGEGMMALNRGFLYAGASNIVYSLFKVPQDSTSRLTQALFQYILKGESYAQALRKAKLELIEDEMMEPMDWAGFALVGG